MNHEEVIILNVGTFVQKFINLINKGFGAKIDYTGFEYFKVEDQGVNFRLTLKLNEYTTIYADTAGEDVSSWVVTIGNTQKGRNSSNLSEYIVELFEWVSEEFGENIHSIKFSMNSSEFSSCELCMDTDGEFDIVWVLISPKFEGVRFLDKLEKNKFYYKHLLSKRKSKEELSFGEAYYFALKYYNNGGDGFVECTDPRDFEKEKSEGKLFTKKSMLKDFKIYKDICDDRMGW